MSVTPQPSSAPGTPDYSQPQAYGAGDGYQGGYPAGYQGGYPAGYQGGYPAGYQGGYPAGYQGGYGYAPMPAQRSSVPLVIGLAVIGFVILIVASALVLLVAAPRNAGQQGFGNGVPAIQASGMDHVSSGAIVAPTVTTPATIPSSGRTLGNASAPVTVDIYEDFQCPTCEAFTITSEPQIVANYVWTGKVKLVYHDFLVIDSGPGGTTESLDAANAALCASDQGQFWPYHDWLFGNQHWENSGEFTKDRLKTIAQGVGIKDLAKFTSCVDDGSHNADIKSAQTQIPTAFQGTPTLIVNGGAPLDSFDYATVSAAIDRALGTSR
jgi:protein-disulfide isomerase